MTEIKLSDARLMPMIDALLDEDLPALRTAIGDRLQIGYASSEKTHDVIDRLPDGPDREGLIAIAVGHLMSLSVLALQVALIEGRMIAAGQLGPCTAIPDCKHPDGHWQSCWTGAIWPTAQVVQLFPPDGSRG